MKIENHSVTKRPEGEGEANDALTLGRIEEALRGLRYGTVTVVVHDGAVVQVDRTEKVRFGSATSR